MADMTKAIEPKSDQMNAEDLLGGARTFTITRVVVRDTPDQPVSVWFAEFPEGRPFKPALTVRKLMVLAWGNDSDPMVGQRMTLFCDPTVKWAGKDVGGIRVSHMSGIRKKISVPLSVTRGRRELYVVEPLSDSAPPAKAPGPLDQLVLAMNAAGIERDPAARLAWCMGIVQRDLVSAKDLTAAELVTVIESLPTTVQTGMDDDGVPYRRTVPTSQSGHAEPSDLDLEPSEEEIARSEGQTR